MSNSSVPRQIIGSFEDIGKDIIRETVKVPQDIVGQALESLGTGGVKSGQSSANVVKIGEADATKKPDKFDEIDKVKDAESKQVIARAALEALIQRPKSKEPTVWDKMQSEAEQKKQLLSRQQTAAAKSNLPVISPKRPKGDLYGLKAKRNAAEIGKNVKSD